MKKAFLIGVLAVAVLFGVVAYSTAASQTFTGVVVAPGQQEASNTVNPVRVAASVNPKITLTVTTPDATQTVDFGAVDPGGPYGGKTVGLSVDSNKQFDLVATQNTAAFGGITLTRSLGAGENNIAKGQAVTRNDAYSITVPWSTDPGAYNAFVNYTVTQD